MAFGTGHHGTTLGCLLALDRLDRAGFTERMWPISAVARRFWRWRRRQSGRTPSSRPTLILLPLKWQKRMSKPMHKRTVCNVSRLSGFDHPDLIAKAPFDLVFANILKGPLIGLAPEMARHIAPNGYAILSGILTTQAEDVLSVYQDHGFTPKNIDNIGEWTTLVLVRNQ